MLFAKIKKIHKIPLIIYISGAIVFFAFPLELYGIVPATVVPFILIPGVTGLLLGLSLWTILRRKCLMCYRVWYVDRTYEYSQKCPFCYSPMVDSIIIHP